MNSKNVLVTGSAGFIGGNFVRSFKMKFPKAKVVGLDIVRSGNGEDFFYRGSICDSKILDRIFKRHRPEYVFHFAAIPRVSYSVLHPAETTYVNIYGTVLLLEKCRDHGIKRFIFSSSSSVYGGAKILPTKESENLPDPKSPYAAHKLADEVMCKLFSDLYGLDTVSLRYFNVYGPGQYGSAPYSTVISAWLEKLYFGKNKKPFIEGDAKKSRDFSYVDDVVQANIKAMQFGRKFGGEVFNIGAGERTDLATIKNLIEKYSGMKLNLEKRPPRAGDVRHTLASVDKAKRVFGYKPETKIEEGIVKTTEWFKQRHK